MFKKSRLSSYQWYDCKAKLAMFKAIGRWGANVKANLNLKFLTNLFGSKSKSYCEIDSDEEEIFSDAREELLDEEEDDDRTVTIESHESSVVFKRSVNGSATIVRSDLVNTDKSSQSDDSSDADDEGIGVENDDIIETKDKDDIFNHDEDHNQKESAKIIETDTKTTNGLIRNASSSAFKKVHRRISSFSQRQYSKMDCDNGEGELQAEKDDNDNIDGSVGAMNGKLKSVKQKSKDKDKKTQKRNKVPLFRFFRGLIRFPFRGNSYESGTK